MLDIRHGRTEISEMENGMSFPLVFCRKALSRPWHREGKPKQSTVILLSREDKDQILAAKTIRLRSTQYEMEGTSQRRSSRNWYRGPLETLAE